MNNKSLPQCVSCGNVFQFLEAPFICGRCVSKGSETLTDAERRAAAAAATSKRIREAREKVKTDRAEQFDTKRRKLPAGAVGGGSGRPPVNDQDSTVSITAKLEIYTSKWENVRFC